MKNIGLSLTRALQKDSLEIPPEFTPYSNHKTDLLYLLILIKRNKIADAQVFINPILLNHTYPRYNDFILLYCLKILPTNKNGWLLSREFVAGLDVESEFKEDLLKRLDEFERVEIERLDFNTRVSKNQIQREIDDAALLVNSTLTSSLIKDGNVNVEKEDSKKEFIEKNEIINSTNKKKVENVIQKTENIDVVSEMSKVKDNSTLNTFELVKSAKYGVFMLLILFLLVKKNGLLRLLLGKLVTMLKMAAKL